MEWFQHKSSGRDERRLFDAMDTFGRDAYYLYYATSELYAKLYGDVDDDGFLTCSDGWLFSQLHIEKGERDRYKKIFQTFNVTELIETEFSTDGQVKIRIPGFEEIASNWVKRKAKETRVRGSVRTPPEGPLEGPLEVPPAVEENRIEKKRTEENIVGDVIDHLNKKAGTVYRKSARESVNHIKGRAKEGATLDDFQIVIDSKVAEWAQDAKMVKYLRPSTLFNSEKFWGYLNAAKMGKKITPTPVGGGYRGSGVAI